LVEKVAAQAHAWIFRQQQQQAGEATQEGDNTEVPF
jgi:hypothetical protein